MDRVIDKRAVTDYLDALLHTHQVFAPVEREGTAGVGIELVDDSGEIVLDFHNTRQAPKEVFFPRSETLFRYKDGEVTPTMPSAEPRVVVGIRPCDARSAVLLDRVFDPVVSGANGTADYRDPYYVSRRRNTVLVGLACNSPLRTCFCSSVGGSPFSVEGLDVLWTDLGDRYLVETMTERGQELVGSSAQFREATEEDRSAKAEISVRAEEAVSGPDVRGVKEKLDSMYDAFFWEEIQRKCLGCGACTYLCPTCHCFDIVDEGNGSRGQRVRNWDTCQLALFTHHASGHNPRPSGKERMRQRVMHKFNYYVENCGAIACVGCGRCVRDCPVNFDIRAVLEAIKQVKE